MRKLLCIVALPLVLLLAACGPNNPLIGKWRATTYGVVSEIEFKSGSIVSSKQGAAIESKIDSYTVEKGRVGLTITGPNGQKVTGWYDIVDNDTITFGQEPMKITFHRVK
jgi:hypothetical protein